MPLSNIVYRLDRDDRITSVSDQWDVFAGENAGGHVRSADVIGRPLWDFISDTTTTEIYRQVLSRIRTGKQMTYSFRCDSPECRRLLEMRIRLCDDDGSVEFETTTLFSGPRAIPPVSQGDGSVGAPDLELVRVCGWCNRFFADGEWREMEEAFPLLKLLEYPEQQRLTHGMCEGCYERMVKEIAVGEGVGSG